MNISIDTNSSNKNEDDSTTAADDTAPFDEEQQDEDEEEESLVEEEEAEAEDTQQMVVMVTGGTGLVGAAIEDYIEESTSKSSCEGETRKRKEKWIFLSSKDGDLTNRKSTELIFEKHQPTHVIHLAAKVGGLFANMSYKVDFLRENLLINDNIYECCRIYNVTKLVSMLSTCIFPDKTTYPVTETMLHDGPPHHSNAGYAYAKRLMDTMNLSYHEQYKCNYTSIIPTNIYGPHDNFNIDAGHVIPGLIHKCYTAKKEGEPFCIWGSGQPLRQFIYSRDLAELTVWTLREYNNDPTPITLSVDESAEVSIEFVARAVAKAMDFDGDIVFDKTKADGQYKKTASNAKFRSLQPDYQFTSMEKGIEKTVEWFVDNYNTARK